jgi:hypothetical protein
MPIDNEAAIPAAISTAGSISKNSTARFLFGDKVTPAEYRACLDLAISRGWLELHESGTFVKITQSGADLFA